MPTLPPRKKLIEVALPLEAINRESAREKSIRHGHPSTLHLWWARRPLAACRAVLFASLVDDPSSDPHYRTPAGTVDEDRAAAKRAQLFRLIEDLVKWENSSNPKVIDAARAEIARCVASRKVELGELAKDLVIHGPGKGSAHPQGPIPPMGSARDATTVWMLVINQAKPDAVNAFLAEHAPPVLDPFCGGGSIPLEAQRLGLRAFGSDLNPVPVLITKALIEIPPKFANLPPVNPESRGMATTTAKATPDTGGKSKKGKAGGVQGQLGDGGLGKWKGAAGLAEDVRYYGRWMRDEAQKRIGHLYPKITVTEAMARDRKDLKEYIGQELTVIAWLWARTVPSPNPAAGGTHVPLVRSFWLSTKEGKKAWVEPVIAADGKSYKFEVRVGTPGKDFDPGVGTIGRKGGRCILTSAPMAFPHVRTEAKAGHMGVRLMAIVAEGTRGRVYISPDEAHVKIAESAKPTWRPDGEMPKKHRNFQPPVYGMNNFGDLFTNRQLVALTTFSDLVMEARARVLADARATGLGGSAGGDSAESARLRAAGSSLPPTGNTLRVGGSTLQTGRSGLQASGSVLQPDGGVPQASRGTLQPSRREANSLHGAPARNHGGSGTAHGGQSAAHGAPALGHGGPHTTHGAQSAAHGGAGTLPGGPDTDAGGAGTDPAADYADAVATYLAFAMDKLSEASSSICTWSSSPKNELVVSTFRRHALPMTWDYAEANLFGPSSGSLDNAIDFVAKAIGQTPAAQFGHVAQRDATAAIAAVQRPVVCTDPPYYDNIGYADLSDYFYVWLRRSLATVYPALFRTLLTPKAEELIATPYRHEGSRDKAMSFFETGLGRAFERMREAEHADYPLTVYYAFKQAESDDGDEDDDGETGSATASTGWETMLEGLIKAGFAITGTWPVRTERGSRSIGIGTNALASSIVLVCHPRPESAPMASRREFVTALKRELPAALRDLQSGNIAPVDLAQAAIGPGMAVFSRYAKVLETSGDRMGVRTALALINQVLDEVLAEQEGEYDADTRWCIKWFEQYGHAEAAFGEADVLARAMGVGVNGLVETGVALAKSGKVRLLKRSELSGGKPETWDPAKDDDILHWEVCQYLCAALETGGEQAAANLLRSINNVYAGAADVARDLAYRLYTVCERKKWAQEAIAYNALVVAWPEIQKLVAKAPSGADTGLFGDAR
jgi:adenine-specific DNA methylase